MSCVVTKLPHELLEVTEKRDGTPGVASVVRWCRDCGAIVIDADVDGRVSPGSVMPMRFPLLALRQTKDQP